MKKKKPIGLDPLKLGLLTSDERMKELCSDRADEELRRMMVLAEELGLSQPFNWYQVALELAKKHVPELKENVKVGAKKKWGATECIVLITEIERLIKDGESIIGACRVLAKKEPWKSFVSEKEGFLGSVDKRLRGLAKDYLAYCESTGDFSMQEELLKTILRK